MATASLMTVLLWWSVSVLLMEHWGQIRTSTRFRVLAPLAMYDPKGATRDVKRDH